VEVAGASADGVSGGAAAVGRESGRADVLSPIVLAISASESIEFDADSAVAIRIEEDAVAVDPSTLAATVTGVVDAAT